MTGKLTLCSFKDPDATGTRPKSLDIQIFRIWRLRRPYLVYIRTMCPHTFGDRDDWKREFRGSRIGVSVRVRIRVRVWGLGFKV